MPRTLPAPLTAALDSGSFTVYRALGRRNYTGLPPSALAGYTTLITNILYYKYDGLQLTIHYASPNLPEEDGLIVGNKYYIERGITSGGVNYTIKSASLRFDNYSITKQIVTAQFSLFSADEKPAAVAGDDTYTNVLTALNPNAYELGTVDFRTTPENVNHWGYNFYAAGKQVSLKSYAALLPHIRQKYLLQAVDNSDDDNEDEIQFYHLRSQSPIGTAWEAFPSPTPSLIRSIAWSPELNLFVAVADTGSQRAWYSADGITWETAPMVGGYRAVTWSPALGLFIAVGDTGAAARSANGTEWTETTPFGNSDNYYAVCWSPELGIFVAASYKIYTSPDGITWTQRQDNFPFRLTTGIAWSPELTLFVACQDPYSFYTSPDGITWTLRTGAWGQPMFTAVAWSASLGLFVATARTNNLTPRIHTSPDGIAWTGQNTPEQNALQAIVWSEEYTRFVAVASDGTDRIITSTDGTTWTASEGVPFNDHELYSLVFSSTLSVFLAAGYDPGGADYILRTITIQEELTITQGDVTLEATGKEVTYLWRDEAETIHTDGTTNDGIHNLGYLESTDSPPADNLNSTFARVTVGVHLKYKTGDIFKLAINAEQYAIYHAKVTEILDPDAEIGWRCEIELIERFANTNGGAMPSTIERVAAYTPLVTTNFDGNLDETVNNLQALADRVDNLIITPPVPTDAPTATNDFLIGAQVSSIWTWVRNTLAQTITVLRTSLDSIYAPIAKGVTNGDSHNHVGGDGAALTFGDILGMNTGVGQTVPASSTYDGGPFYDTLAASGTVKNFPLPRAGTLKNLFIRTATAQPASGSLVLTLLVNSNASALTVTIPANAAAGNFSDTTNSVSVSSTDVIRWQLVNNATGASAQVAAISMQFDGSTT